ALILITPHGQIVMLKHEVMCRYTYFKQTNSKIALVTH
ncbi:Phage terminase large subunit (GpA), partial [Haemophilus influenzae]